MTLAIEQEQDVTTIALQSAAIDASNSGTIRQDLLSTVAGHDHIVLDMEQVSFVDSSGLGALVQAARSIAANGGDMRLCNVNGPVQALFELVRMHKLVSIFDSRSEAVASFTSNS